jgi:quercetin dioxygenase-like cupin family protein
MVTESSPSGQSRVVLAGLSVALVVLLAACGGSDASSSASASDGSSAAAQAADREVLLAAQELTVLDQPIAYPKKLPAQVSSDITQLEPGQETGWHRHRVPVYSYVLEGTISVEYDAGVTKEFAAGTAFVEAEDVWHNGTNTGDGPVRILNVYMGAKGAKNSVERAP